jgi:FkbM family methyltransferase
MLADGRRRRMSKRLARIAKGFTTFIALPQKRWRRFATRFETLKALKYLCSVDTKYGPILYEVTNLRTLETPFDFHEKEPPTIAWFDQVPTDGVLWDIGANAGEFALYAAKRGVSKIIAFEPSPATYANLCRNNEINGFGKNLTVLCLGLLDCQGTTQFHMRNSEAGHSCHSVEARYGGTAHIETILTVSMDFAIEQLGIPAPTHIKLDIDGAEERVIEGGRQTLSSGQVRSVYIEFEENEARFEAISGLMAGLGFERTSVHRPEHLNYFFAEYQFKDQ